MQRASIDSLHGAAAAAGRSGFIGLCSLTFRTAHALLRYTHSQRVTRRVCASPSSRCMRNSAQLYCGYACPSRGRVRGATFFGG